MTAKEVELTTILTKDLGLTIVQIGGGIESRFFAGTIETPTSDQFFLIVIGKEITHFFGDRAMMKLAEQVKIDVNTFMNKTEPLVVKFSPKAEWYCFSR